MSIKRRNRISGQFAARTIEMLESPAYRALSLSAHRLISRIEVELGHHGGNDNGRLPVTKQDFIEYGISHDQIAPAIREADALGFIRLTQRGRGGNAECRQPNMFYLTFAHGRDSRAKPPSHDWRSIETMDEAQSIARAARENKDPDAVRFGQRAASLAKNRNRSRKAGPAPFVIGRHGAPTPTPIRGGGGIGEKLNTGLLLKSEPVRRIEVFTGAGRRRAWTAEQKQRIVAESYGAGETVSAVARRHGMTPQQLFGWRRAAGRSLATGMGEHGPASAPVIVEGAPSRASVVQPSHGSGMPAIEIVIGATTVRVPPGADVATLQAVLCAVKAMS